MPENKGWSLLKSPSILHGDKNFIVCIGKLPNHQQHSGPLLLLLGIHQSWCARSEVLGARNNVHFSPALVQLFVASNTRALCILEKISYIKPLFIYIHTTDSSSVESVNHMTMLSGPRNVWLWWIKVKKKFLCAALSLDKIRLHRLLSYSLLI